MGELGVSDLHGNRGQAFADVANPVVTASGGKGLGHSFVERFGRHLQRMRSLVQVVDDDSAGFEGHEGNLSYSLFVRLAEQRKGGGKRNRRQDSSSNMFLTVPDLPCGRCE